MSKPLTLKLGRKALPLDLTDFGLEDAACLSGFESGPVSFDFTFRGLSFNARFEETEDSALLRVVGQVGILPYSAQSPSARVNLRAIVASANEVLGDVFRIGHDSRILFGGHMPIDRPVSAVSLIVAASLMLLPAAPYFECLDACKPPPKAQKKWGRQRAS